MASRGHAAVKPKGATRRAPVSSVFRIASRDAVVALDTVKRLAGRSAGSPLDDTTRAEMEACFGHDFSRVRLHTDDAADALAEALGAEAVTFGDDIYFAQGAYRPGDSATQTLLAHELAHIVQRGKLAAQVEPARISGEDEPLEHQAEASALDVARGMPPDQSMQQGAGQAALTVALRATRPRARSSRMREPDLPLGEMRIVDRLAGMILGDFWKDPDDKAGRVRNQFGRLGESTQREVLEVIQTRLADADGKRFAALVDTDPPLGSEVNTAAATDADVTDREQRQERTSEETGAARNQDATAEQSARLQGDVAVEAKSAALAGEAQERAKADGRDSEDKDSAARETDATGEAESDGNAGADQEVDSESSDKDSNPNEQTAGERDQAHPKDKTDATKPDGEKSESSDASNAPDKPRVGEGGGDGDQRAQAQGDARPDAAGGQERPPTAAAAGPAPVDSGGDAGAAMEVDASPFDHLLAPRHGDNAHAKARHGVGSHDESASQESPSTETHDDAAATTGTGEGELAATAQPASSGDVGPASETDLSAATAHDEAASAEDPQGGNEAVKEPSAEASAQRDADAVGAEGQAQDGGKSGAAAPESPGTDEGADSNEATHDEDAGGGESESSAGQNEEADAGSGEASGEASSDAQVPVGADTVSAEVEGGGASADEGGGAAPTAESGGGADDTDGGEVSAGAEAANDSAEAAPAARAADAAPSTPSAMQAADAATRRTEPTADQSAARTGTGETSAGEAAAGAPARLPDSAAPQTGAQAATGRSVGALASATAAGESTQAGFRDRGPPGDGTSQEPADGLAGAPGVGSSAALEGETAGPTADRTTGAVRADDTGAASTAQAGPEAGVSAQAPAAGQTSESDAPTTAAGGPAVGDMGDMPAAQSDGGGGDGGGGGGAAAPATAERPSPEVEPTDRQDASPPQALAALAGRPPARLLSSLGAVTTASGRAIEKQRSELAQHPPQIERPSGAPKTHPPTADPAALARKLSTAPAGKVDPLPAGQLPAALPAATPADLGQQPAIPAATVTGDAPIEARDAAQMQAAVSNLPTSDPGLNVTAGDAPNLELEGAADPQQIDEHQAAIDKTATDASEQGAADAAQPMGEDAIYPQAPAETLKANVGEEAGGDGGGAPTQAAGAEAPAGTGAAAAGGGDAEQAASIIAQQQRGDEIATRVEQQGAAMQEAQSQHNTEASAKQEANQKDVDDAIEQSAADQEGVRSEARQQVVEQRKMWTRGQSDAVKTMNDQGAGIGTRTHDEVVSHEQEGRGKAQDAIGEGNRTIVTARTDAERKAGEERTKAQRESNNFWSWIGSKVTDFFNAIREAIQVAFDAARTAIKAAIKKAQDLAAAAINIARDAIIKAIQAAAAALVKAADVMLAAFPELRDKFKAKLSGLVDAAVKAVNVLADALKKTITVALNLLGKGLDLLVVALGKAYMAAVDSVASFVKGVLDTAKGFVESLGVFAVLIKDIAANPGQWLSKLAAAAVDGIRHHLIAALKDAIRNWFNSTVESVIGVGKTILAVLKMGGIKFATIAKLAWEALKAAVPALLIHLLIEKLVALIVPAAGLLMTIIEGLQAAWGTVQQVITAFDKFVTFLKAVKSGQAGRLFAETLASAAIAVIQFVAQWLLRKLMKPGAKVGGKLQEIAKKILAGVKRVGAKVAGALKKAGKAVVRAVKATIAAIRKGAARIGAGIKGGLRKIAASPLVRRLLNSPAGRRIAGLVRKAATKVKGAYEGVKTKVKARVEAIRKKAKELREKTVEKRFNAGLAAIDRLMASTENSDSGMPRFIFVVRLYAIKLMYGFTSLVAGDTEIDARMNPSRTRRIKGKLLSLRKLDPAYPPDVKSHMLFRHFRERSTGQWQLSGSTRTRPPVLAYHFHPTGNNKGSWRRFVDDKKAAAGERAAARYLKSEYEPKGFESLVSSDKKTQKPGADVAGIGFLRSVMGKPKDVLTLGDAKTSTKPGGATVTAKKTTAFSKNLTSTLNRIRDEAGLSKARVDKTIMKGDVRFVVYLAKGTRMMPEQREKLAKVIRTDLKTYLRKELVLGKAQIKKAVPRIQVLAIKLKK